MKERASHDRLLSSLNDGVASVELRFRDCGITQVERVMVPRYVSFHTFQCKVEQVFKQRVLLSYVATGADDASRNSSGIRSATPGRASATTAFNSTTSTAHDLTDDIDDEEERAKRMQRRFVELNPKTILRFLHMPKPVCAVRALVSGMGAMSFGGVSSANTSTDNQSPTINNTTTTTTTTTTRGGKAKKGGSGKSPNYTHLMSNSALAEHLNSVQRGPQRIDQIKKLLNEIEKPEVYGKKLTAEERETAIERLYSRPMRTIEERRRDYDDFCVEGTHKYMNTTKKMAPTLSEREEEIVHKLFEEGIARKEASLARAEEQLQERVPKPHQKTLEPSELDDLGDRLWKKCLARKKENVEKATQRVYGAPTERKVVDLDALVDSVYTKAVDKKKGAVERLRGEYGDFRSKKSKKKLTQDQIKEMGDRLCKK